MKDCHYVSIIGKKSECDTSTNTWLYSHCAHHSSPHSGSDRHCHGGSTNTEIPQGGALP